MGAAAAGWDRKWAWFMARKPLWIIVDLEKNCLRGFPRTPAAAAAATARALRGGGV